MGESWRIALIDSGVMPGSGLRVAAERDFVEGGASQGRAPGDRTGHGTALAEIIQGADLVIDWYIARVLDASGRSTPAAVAAAVDWAVAQRVHLIHLSLGLRRDRGILADSIGAAVRASVVVVASSPARGDITYPAAYPGVIRATGDVRCCPDEISALSSRQADFGGCAQHRNSQGRVLQGASVGAAYVTRFLVRSVTPGQPDAALRRELRALSAHLGPERRAS